MNVTLLDHSTDPLRSLYNSYRVAYSRSTPEQLDRDWDELAYATREMREHFIRERLAAGHTSPLEQVWFEFAISGVSRAFSHQFVRTRVGMSVEQQSQRYVVLKDGYFDAVEPPSIAANPELTIEFQHLLGRISNFYRRSIEAGIPAEDVRFILPNATATNLKITINFAALRYMSGQRLCTRAQWEYRKVVAKMGALVREQWPLLGEFLTIKCLPGGTLGMCDEDYSSYLACPVAKSKHPPLHRSMLAQLPVVQKDGAR